MEIDENRVRDIIKEELANFSPPKKKRAPNKWQVFLKDCVKTQDSGLAYPEKVKACSVIYKGNKNGNSNASNNNSEIPESQESEIERLSKLTNKKLAQLAK